MTRASRVLAAVTTTVASIVLSGFGAAPPAAASTPQVSNEHGIGIRLLDAAVARKDDPRAQIYIDDHVRPGTTITRHVLVSDFTPNPVTLQMYAVASSIDTDGWQVAPGRAGNELTSWMHVSPSTVALQPGKSAPVTVQIAVPVNASKAERYATIVAELPPPATSAGQAVRVATRVGVRVYLDVSAGGEPPSDFRISTLTAARTSDGVPTVTAHVTNTGARALDLGGQLSLSDGPGGLRAGPYDVRVPRTLGIHETGDVVVYLDKQTPVGPWLARMTLRSGYVQHAVTGRVSFPVKAGTSAKPVAATPVPLAKNRHVLVPIAGLLILGLVVGLLLFLLWKRRRRKDDEDEDTSAGTPTTPGVPAQRQRQRAPARR